MVDCSNWRRWLKPIVMSLYLVMFVVTLPLCIWQLQLYHAELYMQGWFIGGLFVLFAIPISLWGILQHLVNYTQPFLQRHVIRILWMVPIYAIDSWFALRFPGASIYLATVRECYEAYVIYNFLIYLLNYLHSQHSDLETVLECKPPVKHMIPLCFLKPWRMGGTFIQHCKHGVIQYTIVRPVITVIALFCEWGHVYGEGNFNFKNAWSYLVVITNISQILAMYCLILFYRATKQELAPLKPLSKFLCVKAVVFMSFWQSVLIAILVISGVITSNPKLKGYTTERIATGLQDFCICIEMFIAAIAHYFSFSHTPFISSGHEQIPCCTLVLTMCDVSDVHDDVFEHARFVGKTVSGAVSGPLYRRNGAKEERQPLLTDQSPRHTTRPQAYMPPIQLKLLSRANEEEEDSDNEVTFQERQLTESMCNYAQFERSIVGDEKLDTADRVESDGVVIESIGEDERTSSGEGLEKESESEGTLHDMDVELDAGAKVI